MISKPTYLLLQWVDAQPCGVLYEQIQRSDFAVTSAEWNQLIRLGLVALDGGGYRLTERGRAEMEEHRHNKRARMRSNISLVVSILSLLVAVLALVRTF